MSADLRVKIDGLKDLKRALERLAPELRKSSQSAVLRAGAKPILKQEKARAPVADGTLKRSLGIKLLGKGIKTSAKIGVRKGFKGKSLGFKMSRRGATRGQMTERFADPTNYGHLVEFGTSHSPANPFVRNSIEAASGEVIDAMANGLDKHLTKVAANMARNRRR